MVNATVKLMDNLEPKQVPGTADALQETPPDSLSEKEDASVNRAKLDDNAYEGEHKRREVIRKHLHWGMVGLLWLGMVSIAALLLTWVYHIVAPNSCHWLSVEQLNKAQNVLFSAILAAVVSDYAKKHLA